jgi:hypothetical protein
VRAVGEARIDYLEGELTWRAKVGDTVKYAEGEGGGQLHSIEWTSDEVEFYRGNKLDRATTEKAFGIERAAQPAAAGGRGGCSRVGCIVALVILVVVIGAWVLLVPAFGGTSGGSTSGSSSTGSFGTSHYSSGSIRSGSTGRSLGGGFSGHSSSGGSHGGK